MTNEHEHDDESTQGPLVPNVWQLKGARNPYLHNIFALLGLRPDDGQASFGNSLERAKQRISTQPPTVHGRELALTDVTRAEAVARDAPQFVSERLLAHTVHQMDVKRFNDALKALDAVKLPKAAELLPLPIEDVSFLAQLLPEVADATAGSSPPVPLAELELLFGEVTPDERIMDL